MKRAIVLVLAVLLVMALMPAAGAESETAADVDVTIEPPMETRVLVTTDSETCAQTLQRLVFLGGERDSAYVVQTSPSDPAWFVGVTTPSGLGVITIHGAC